MAIGSVVEALQAGAGEDPVLRPQFLTSLERLVERQTSLLRDLLDISRLDGGLEDDWHDDVSIVQVINDAVEQLRPQAAKKEVDLINQDELNNKGEPSAMIRGNSLQLQRAIVNILTNAVNYTPAAGTVSVSTRFADSDRVAIKVHDNGVGIDSADLPHIFERFYRADKARTRASGGTGLGLAITREIVARHHGTIEVESVFGKGSTFTIFLPAISRST
jgi:signal transduction histidine kinase